MFHVKHSFNQAGNIINRQIPVKRKVDGIADQPRGAAYILVDGLRRQKPAAQTIISQKARVDHGWHADSQHRDAKRIVRQGIAVVPNAGAGSNAAVRDLHGAAEALRLGAGWPGALELPVGLLYDMIAAEQIYSGAANEKPRLSYAEAMALK
jgi:hypothetical protein